MKKNKKNIIRIICLVLAFLMIAGATTTLILSLL